MKLALGRRLALASAWVLLAASAHAQAPISPGEAQAGHSQITTTAVRSTLAGQVVGPSGEPLPGVAVAVVAADGSRRTTVTGADGRFRLQELPVGQLRVEASRAGFATVRRGITLAPGESAQLSLMLGGPVSPGEPGPGGGGSSGEQPTPPPEPEPEPAPTAGPVVVEREFSDDVVLQDWLNQETVDGFQLAAVVPLEAGTSLFVFARPAAATTSIVILDASADLTPERLGTRIAQHAGKRFLGIHRLGPGATALVFLDGP